MGHRHVEDAAQGLELLLGADAVAVHAHQRDILRAILQHITGGQLGQGGGLAHAGGADHGDHTALFQRFDFRRGDHARQMRQQHAPGLAGLFDFSGQGQQVAGQRAGQADALQATPEVGLLRLAALQLGPGQRAELHFEQFTQAVEFKTHRVDHALVNCGRRGRRCRTRRFDERGLNQRLGGGQRQAGKQLAIGAGIAVATHAQFSLGRHNARGGLAQLVFEFHVRHARGQRLRRVIQGSRQLNTAGNPTVTDNRGIGAQLIADQFHGLTHIGGEKTLNLHNPLPQPLGPTVATIVTCLLSGISW